MREFKICKVHTNNYKLSIGKHLRKIAILQCFVMVFFICNIIAVHSLIFSMYTDEFIEIVPSVARPFSPLYKDESSIVFTSGALDNLKRAQDLKFVLPIHSLYAEETAEGIDMIVDTSIMVKSPEDGIVEDIYTVSGVKILRIRHAENVYSEIKNLDILGVVVGQTVARGKDIGTAKQKSVVTLSIYLDDNLQKLTLTNSGVEWVS